MDSMTAAEAKQKFGQLIEKAQRGPVEITKHGRRVGVFVSDEWFKEDAFYKNAELKRSLQRSLKQMENGEGRPLEDVMNDLRRKYAHLSEVDAAE